MMRQDHSVTGLNPSTDVEFPQNTWLDDFEATALG
jgi:hypothetical protein